MLLNRLEIERWDGHNDLSKNFEPANRLVRNIGRKFNCCFY